MKKNNKAFTLIELLAIIIILALIAVITVPIVLNVIDKSKKGAAKNSAYGILESAKSSYFMDDNIDTSSFSCSFPSDCNILDYNGSTPTSGNIMMNQIGIIYGEVTFDNKYSYCIYESDVYDVTCENTIVQELKKQVKEKGKTHIYNSDGTIDKEKIYSCIGFDVEVAENVLVPFCIIGETDDEVTLVTKGLLGRSVSWSDSGAISNSYGPTSIFESLLDETKNWTNIPVITSFSYDDNKLELYGYNGLVIADGVLTIKQKDDTEVVYGDSVDKFRARVLTVEEAKAITDGEPFDWLTDSWTISSSGIKDDSAWLIMAPNASSKAKITEYAIHDTHGVKAVITIDKDELK